jgi:hypothetical protein
MTDVGNSLRLPRISKMNIYDLLFNLDNAVMISASITSRIFSVTIYPCIFLICDFWFSFDRIEMTGEKNKA